jgi:hypothetical protein
MPWDSMLSFKMLSMRRSSGANSAFTPFERPFEIAAQALFGGS